MRNRRHRLLKPATLSFTALAAISAAAQEKYDSGATDTVPQLLVAQSTIEIPRNPKGDSSGGNSDIAAAKAIQANIDEEFARDGVK